jgi:sulfur transfer protein SufE
MCDYTVTQKANRWIEQLGIHMQINITRDRGIQTLARADKQDDV